MKRLLILALCMWGIARAQTPPANYTSLNSRYQWLAGQFKALTAPAGITPALTTGQWPIAGALFVDTSGGTKGLYVYYDGVWNNAGGISSNIYTADGVLQGNRLLTGQEYSYSLTYDSLTEFNVSTGSASTANRFATIALTGDDPKVRIGIANVTKSAIIQADNTGIVLSASSSGDSIYAAVGGSNKLIINDSFRIRQNVRLDGAMKLKKGTASRWLGVQDENGRDAIQHSWNTAAKIYFQYLYDTAGAFHWNIFNEARTATWIVFGVKRYLTRVSDTAYFGLGNFPGDPGTTYEPLQEGYMWMNDATANFRGYRNGLSRSFVMNNTGYGVDTVYLNGAGDSLVFEIFGRRYAFLKGSGGGGGTPGGSNTQVQYNSGGSFAGSAAFTYNSGVATLGASGTLGGIDLLGSTSGTVSIRPKTTAGTWTMSLPNSAGSNRQFLQTDGTGALAWAHGLISDLGAAGSSNTIDNGANAQEWQWNSLAGGTGLKLSASTTAAASNTQSLFNVELSGANGTSSQTTSAVTIANTHTGTTSKNIGATISASGATNNFGARISPALLVGSPTENATDGVIIQSPTNTATDGLRIYANNNSSFMQYGWATITRAGAMTIATTSGAINVTPSTGLYVGSTSTPTALFQLAAGTTSKPPMRFTSGSLATGGNILAGNVEFLTDKWYGTISTGPAAKEFTMNDAPLTSGTVPVATTNGRLTDGLIIASGTYTPTLTNGANITSSTVNGVWTYQRVGSVVTVSGSIGITQTAGSVSSDIGISLPVASAMTLSTDANGSLNNEGSLSAGKVIADATNDRAVINWYPSGTTALNHTVMFQYIIK